MKRKYISNKRKNTENAMTMVQKIIKLKQRYKM